jgi:GDP-mannose transporter
MSNKKNEDIEMRAADAGDDFGGEKDPFLGKPPSPSRPRREAGFSAYFDKLDHSPGASILAYCLSSISMTVVNKYVVSGSSWNLNFFYLAVQVCLQRRILGETRIALTATSPLFARSQSSCPSRLAFSRILRLSTRPRRGNVRQPPQLRKLPGTFG